MMSWFRDEELVAANSLSHEGFKLVIWQPLDYHLETI
jgi:hypothetical protein